jgi:hypothetical protein
MRTTYGRLLRNFAVTRIEAASVARANNQGSLRPAERLLSSPDLALVRLGGYLRPPRAAFVRLQDSHLFEDAGEVRDRPFVYRQLFSLARLHNLRQVSASENREEAQHHSPSKRRLGK